MRVSNNFEKYLAHFLVKLFLLITLINKLPKKLPKNPFTKSHSVSKLPVSPAPKYRKPSPGPRIKAPENSTNSCIAESPITKIITM